MAQKESLLKAMRELKTHRTKCLGVVPPGASLELLLAQLGELWDQFVLKHDDMTEEIDKKEDEAAQQKMRDRIVKGKSMEAYYEEAEAVYEEAEGNLQTRITRDTSKREKMEITRIERELNTTNRSIDALAGQIGQEYLDQPDQLETLEEAKLRDTQMKLKRLFKCVKDQEEGIEKAEMTDGISEELVTRSQQVVERLRAQGLACEMKLDILIARPRHESTRIQNPAQDASRTNYSALDPTAPSFNLSHGPPPNVTPNPALMVTGQEPAMGYLGVSDLGLNGSMAGPIHSTPLRSSVRLHSYSQISHIPVDPGGRVSANSSMKLRYTDWPTFSGYWYDWSQWYSKWRHLVEPQGFPSMKLAEQLLECVKGEAFKRIESVIIEDDDSYVTMMNRLIKLYTDPGRLLSWIYYDLDSFQTVPEGNHVQIVALANRLEKIYSNLYAIDKSYPAKVISNKVDDLARLLPVPIQDRWDRWYIQLDEAAKISPFAQFVSFICMEREVSDRHLPLSPKGKPTKGKFVGSLDQDSGSGSQGSGASGYQASVPFCWMTPGHKGHWTRACPDFKALTPSDRRKKILTSKKCLACLESYSRDHKCKLSTQVLDMITCKRSNCPSRVKHRRDVSCNFTKISPVGSQEDECETVGYINGQVIKYVGIYQVKVPHKDNTLTVFTDDGSTISLIHEATAISFGFKQVAHRSTVWLRTINGVKPLRDVKIFEVPLITYQGVVVAYCFSQPDYIDSSCPQLDMVNLRKMFPKYRNIERLQRPTGPIQVLIGLEHYTDLHPERRLFKSGKMAIVRGPLGDTVIGAQESVELGSQYSIQDVHVHDSYYISKECNLEIDRFILGDELGIRTESKCRSCTNCVQCPILGHDFSWKEQKELELIRQGIEFNESVPRWETSLPFTSPKEEFPDNMSMAYATLYSTERTLDKDPLWAKTYYSNIQGYIDEGFARAVSEEEWRSRQGLPFWFLPHLAVLNVGSVTTPVRTVFDSGRRYKGVCLNDRLAKGPKAYAKKLLHVVLRWREEAEVLVGDIKGMFHHIGVKFDDQFMQCFLYRSDRSKDPQIYVMTVLIMGHICSPCIATESVFKTGHRVEDSKPEVSYVLNNSTYVDDVVHSVEVGSKELARDIHQTLKDHGFTIKQWQFSGESCGRNEEELFSDMPVQSSESLLKGHGGTNLKVLGVGWNPKEDLIVFTSDLNFSAKRKGKRSGPDATVDTLLASIPLILTRRVVLEQVMRPYDPIGLIGPYLLCGKILLRRTWELGLQWDDAIPDDLRAEWIKWFQVAFQLVDLTFPRCTRPRMVLECDPWLVIFKDGSKTAYGFTAYVRWRVGESDYQSFLILAKCRIAPMAQISIPRMELNGSLLGVRGRKCLLDACRYKFARIIHLVDSETVLFQVTSTNKTFKMYEACRLGEIQTTCAGDMRDWYWVPTEYNIADWNTRGRSPEELGPGSEWQDGPRFLSGSFKEWPIKSVDELRKSQSVDLTSFHVSLQSEEVCFAIRKTWLTFSRTSWEIMVRGLSIVIGCIRNRSFRQVVPTPGLIREAELVIVKEVQLGLLPELDPYNPDIASKSRYRILSPLLTSEGIWCVGGRSRGATSYPILIPKGHTCALILMARAHKKARHGGVYSTLAKFREEYYVTYGSRLAKRVRQRCSLCRLIDQHTLSQKMGKIPLFLLQEAPVFNFIQLDIFGPWLARGEIQKRTTGKIWGVLFVCLNSKAVHIEFIPGYSTDDFLMGFSRFCSLRGWPAKVYSDPGSQLTAAEEELRLVWDDINKKQVSAKLAIHGTDWKFSPADSPHRQGVVEALIKTVKRSVKVIYGHGHRLSWQEYSTLGYEVADLINSRPLGVKSVSDDVISVLTPNSLILGRNSSNNPGGCPESNAVPRISTVNRIICNFWKSWMQLYKPAMLLERKWNSDVRNLQVGDVVLVIDNDALTRSYKLAQVTTARPDEDGKVRTVEVAYKRYKSSEQGTHKYTGGSTTNIKRSVQRLSLIVPIEESTMHQNDW